MKKKGKKPAKGGRDYRGVDRKTGKKDSGPGPSSPIKNAMLTKLPMSLKAAANC